jgi:hypothetical protein
VKPLSDFHNIVLQILVQSVEDEEIYTWTARDVKGKKDVVIVGTLTEDEGREVTIPLAILPSEEENIFEKYDLNYYSDKPPVIRNKKWWQFWL